MAIPDPALGDWATPYEVLTPQRLLTFLKGLVEVSDESTTDLGSISAKDQVAVDSVWMREIRRPMAICQQPRSTSSLRQAPFSHRTRTTLEQ